MRFLSKSKKLLYRYCALADGFDVNGTEIVYNTVMPGTYTLTVSDNGGKYADMQGSFAITTDKMPAAYSDSKIIKSGKATEAEFANFIKNITSVSVNGKSYSASGRGAVKIIGSDGTIDFSASSKDGNVFDGSGNYIVSVRATGYTNVLEFLIGTDINMMIDYVNSFTNGDEGGVIVLTDEQIRAIKYVIDYDKNKS